MTSSEPTFPLDEDGVPSVVRSLAEIASALKRMSVPAPVRRAAPPLGTRHAPVLTNLLLDGPMTVSALAGAIGIELTTASLLVRELETAGYVSRREDRADRRRTIVAIVPRGRQRVSAWLAEEVEPIRAVLQSLDRRDRAVVVSSVAAIASGMRQRAGTRPPRRPPAPR